MSAAFPVTLPVAALLAVVVLLALGLAVAVRRHAWSRAELMRVKNELEQRVGERTRALEETNQTLEWKVREVEMTESLLRRSEQYFRALIEHGSDLVVVLRSDGRVRYQSPSIRHRLGYTADESLDRHFSDFLHSEDVPAAAEMFAKVMEVPNATTAVQLRVRERQGGYRTAECVAQNLLDDPAVTGVVVTARDVTDRVTMERALNDQEAQLRQAQKMEAVGRLAGGVAHDFNNALTIIGGHAEYLGQSLPGDDPLHQEAVEIGGAVDRAAQLTRQLLTFSRREVAQPQSLDLSATVDGLRPMVARLLPENIRLGVALADDVRRVLADPGQIEQVVLNLVLNSRDAVGPNGEIRVSTEEMEAAEPIRSPLGDLDPGRYVLLTVDDNGHGIAPEIQDQIFDPFFTTKGAGGSGLGLSTVFGIVRDSGGTITVDSTVGEGCTVRIYLPVHEGRVDSAISVSSEELEDLDLVEAVETVLYVEDEDRLRTLTARTLRERGYVVLTAANAADALHMAELYSEPIDLLVTDVVMPGQTGPELHRELEARRGRLPVLFVSGYPGEELARRGFQGGRFLAKPYQNRRLLATVRLVLDEG